MVIDNKYGYKLCYEEQEKNKLKVHLVTNNFDLAIWEIENYLKYPQIDKKDKHIIKNPKWHLFEVKTSKEYNKLWKGCPFKDDL